MKLFLPIESRPQPQTLADDAYETVAGDQNAPSAFAALEPSVYEEIVSGSAWHDEPPLQLHLDPLSLQPDAAPYATMLAAIPASQLHLLQGPSSNSGVFFCAQSATWKSREQSVDVIITRPQHSQFIFPFEVK